MQPDPSPRPAALDDALLSAMVGDAQGAYESDNEYGVSDADMEAAIIAAIKAASEHGWTLLPRAELDEAADALAHATGIYGAGDALANRLRQRSRG